MTIWKAASDREVSWGVVGRNRLEALRLDRGVDRDGVVRVVEPGVEYVLDSEGTDGTKLPFPLWRKRSDGRYEMDPMAMVRPFSGVFACRSPAAEALHKTSWRGEEEELRMLDSVAVQLLRVLGTLHSMGFGVGLLQPTNVLILPGTPAVSLSLILPDFGFLRFRGVLPEWMSPNVPFRMLWDMSPERMNDRSFDRLRYTKLAKRISESAEPVHGRGLDPQSDLHTVARLLAWMLAPDAMVSGRRIPSPEPRVMG